MIRKLFALFLLIVSLYFIQIGCRLFYQPKVAQTPSGYYDQDLYRQLQFLKDALHEGRAGEKMQSIYPEGYVFLHALYGMSWANAIQFLNADADIYQEGIAELKWVISCLEGKSARAIFPEDMRLPYGIFYQAWTNRVRGQYLALLATPNEDKQQAIAFQRACRAIAAAVEMHHQPFLFSYHNGCWPADNVVGLSVLALHDRIFDPTFEHVRQDWLVSMCEQKDEYGLIPHEVDLTYGNSRQSARGSSQSLMLAFWPEIDPDFAKDQWEKYQQLFVDKRLGLPGIREYPKGSTGWGDIDAGPVIWGIGGAASIVGMGSAAQAGDTSLATGLRAAIEGFGCPIGWHKKRYLGGAVPMADAFIAWGHSRIFASRASSAYFSKRGFLSIMAATTCSLLLLSYLLYFKSEK